MKCTVRFLLLVVILSTVLALPSTFFTQREEVISFVREQPTKSIKDAFYTTETLKGLSADNLKAKDLCTLASKTLSSDTNDLESIFYAVTVAEDLNCGKEISQKATEAIFKTLDSSSSSVQQIYFAVASALRLKNSGRLDIKTSDLAACLETISDRATVSGTFKNLNEDPKGSLFFTGLALQTIGSLNRSELTKDQRALLRELKESSSLDSYSTSEKGIYYFDRTGSPLSVTTALVRGVFSIGIKIDSEILAGITEFALTNQHPTTLEEAFELVQLFETLSANKAVPASVTVLQTTLLSGVKGEGNVKIRVTDLLGQALPGVKVHLLKATSFQDDQVLLSNQALYNSKDSLTDFEFNFFLAKPDKGFYELELGVQLDQQPLQSTTRTIKVLSSVSLDAVSLNLIDSSDKEIISRYKATEKKTFETFSASYYYILDFSFVVRQKSSNKPTSVQQAFIRISGNGFEQTYGCNFVGDKYSLPLNLRDVGADFRYQSGDYKLELIVGDTFIDNSFIWSLGTVQISFPPSLQTESENVYAFKPEISHKFRVPETRPPTTVSFTFTCLVLSPFVVLILGLLITGVDIQIPGGIGFISAVVFFGSVLASFGLNFLFFWGELNMFETLKYLGALSVVTFWSGKTFLRDRAQRRTKPKQD